MPRPSRPRGAGRGDSGAAVADFAMVAALVTLLFVAVFQLGLALHIRNTLISCASEGARLGARDGARPEEGAQRTRELIAASLSPRFAQDVSVSLTESGGVQAVSVRVVAPLPVLGPLGPDRSLDVVGRAFLESQ
ncbi:TadE family protein [Pedococcus sp. KACC 23699]|uniref:TadE family protein n=1 Tax=Pedococcus sp. KACC 23699 TaxID=3149228 RepID=A0AAU7JVB4_9MICO